jgi:phosphoribosylanthranilate isomerase
MKLKVCGMKYEDNIRQLVKLNPDYIGFNFYTRSKRYVGNKFDASIAAGIPKRIKKVGIFVNSKEEYIKEKIRRFKLDYVQLHGKESPEFCRRLSKYAKVIKAFGVDEHFDFNILGDYKPYVEYFLFDTKTTRYGGSGKKFNWGLLKKDINKPFFVSGGIDSGEIAEILNLKSLILNLTGIDINSKFEIKPGLKDIEKIKKLKNEIPG